MTKLSKIVATQMGCDYRRAQEAIDRLHKRLKRRDERASKKMNSARTVSSRIDEKTLQAAVDSQEENEAFETMLLILDELLEDVDLEEVEKTYQAEKAKKVMN